VRASVPVPVRDRARARARASARARARARARVCGLAAVIVSVRRPHLIFPFVAFVRGWEHSDGRMACA
jgi:hypothetical protein